MSKYHDNAQHIDNSRTIHIDGSIPNLEGFLRDFQKEDTPKQETTAPVIHVEQHFHGPVGQAIAHVDTLNTNKTE